MIHITLGGHQLVASENLDPPIGSAEIHIASGMAIGWHHESPGNGHVPWAITKGFPIRNHKRFEDVFSTDHLVILKVSNFDPYPLSEENYAHMLQVWNMYQHFILDRNAP